jgi:RNA polymerase sigma factor, sigma-70 family
MNRSQYNKCVELYSDGLFRFILTNIRDKEKAEDIVQETFTKAWEKVESITYEKSKSYLFTTAYHTMIDYIRKNERMTDFPDEQQMPCEIVFNDYSDLSEILNKALKTLPEIQRSVILLRDYEGYSYEEIGNITGLSESQVKVYIFRGRNNLKQYLQKIDNLINVAS